MLIFRIQFFKWLKQVIAANLFGCEINRTVGEKMNNIIGNRHAMPFSVALRAILTLTWIEARRGRFFWLLSLLIVVVEASGWLIGSMAITESDQIRMVVTAWLYRCGIVFILLVHVTGNLVREVDSCFLHVLLSHPISRTQYVVGRLLGFSSIAVLAGLVVTGVLALRFPETGMSGLLLWGGTFSLELVLVSASAVFFSLGFARLLPALIAAGSFYVVARLLDVIRVMAQSPIGQDPDSLAVRGARWALDSLSLITPPLSSFSRTEWLVSVDSLGGAIAFLILGAVTATFLLATAAVVDFHGHEL